MSIFGNLQELSLADIIQIIAGSQKTGVLYVNTDEGRSTIVFKNGFVVSASKPDLAIRLGQLLRRENQISEIELEMCLKDQQQTGKPLGEILLERLLVSRDQLQGLMKLQVMETVNEIVNLDEGSFSFHANAQLPPDHIAFDAQHLLLDVAFLQDTSGPKKAAAEGGSFSPQNLIAGLDDEAPFESSERGEQDLSTGSIHLLRELAEELARPKESTEVSLLVMRLAAECFDRCLFFVVREDSLVTCGGFGFALQADTQQSHPERLVVPLRGSSIFKIVYESKKVYRGTLLEGAWGRDLIARLSPRLPNEVLVLPIVCQEEVIALLYGDNGIGQGDIPSSDLLQILLLQAGMALENSRLRDKLYQLTAAASLPVSQPPAN
ncbi:MAG: DUF4388 domain-containing protein [Acidobacteria bacterium]|nr:DUF4388 domain-containing protein [Acidobacteriota bacterium]